MKDSVSNHVASFRTKKGITQEELAKKIDVTRQTIIAIEKGNYAPSVILALKIARFFGQPVGKLFFL